MLEQALKEIKRGVSEIIDEERIITLVKNFLEKGETFLVKAGFDPTAPDLHLGHTVLLQKMAMLQKYGAIVQFLIGDFTGMIGDPTGKNETRKKLTREVVLANAQSYKEQVFKILDPEKTIVMFNSEWIEALGAAGLVGTSILGVTSITGATGATGATGTTGALRAAICASAAAIAALMRSRCISFCAANTSGLPAKARVPAPSAVWFSTS